MINELYDADFYSKSYNPLEEKGKIHGSDLAYSKTQQQTITEIFRSANKDNQYVGQIQKLMARCTRDIGFEFTYEDQHGNKYGVGIEIRGSKESEESKEIECDDKPDSRDHDYE